MASCGPARVGSAGVWSGGRRWRAMSFGRCASLWWGGALAGMRCLNRARWEVDGQSVLAACHGRTKRWASGARGRCGRVDAEQEHNLVEWCTSGLQHRSGLFAALGAAGRPGGAGGVDDAGPGVGGRGRGGGRLGGGAGHAGGGAWRGVVRRVGSSAGVPRPGGGCMAAGHTGRAGVHVARRLTQVTCSACVHAGDAPVRPRCVLVHRLPVGPVRGTGHFGGVAGTGPARRHEGAWHASAAGRVRRRPGARDGA